MRNLTSENRIVLGIAAIAVIAGGLGAFTLVQLNGIDQRATMITTESLPGMAVVGQIEFLAQRQTRPFSSRTCLLAMKTEKRTLLKMQANTQKIGEFAAPVRQNSRRGPTTRANGTACPNARRFVRKTVRAGVQLSADGRTSEGHGIEKK